LLLDRVEPSHTLSPKNAVISIRSSYRCIDACIDAV